MKRFHMSLSVTDLDQSIGFYTTLFGQEPTVKKDDYAKWMLDDPRLNLSLSKGVEKFGVDHVGLQTDDMEELKTIQERLAAAQLKRFDQADTECCYSRSSKTWVRDPDGVAWETFVTLGEISHYGNDKAAPVEHRDVKPDSGIRCCDAKLIEGSAVQPVLATGCCAPL